MTHFLDGSLGCLPTHHPQIPVQPPVPSPGGGGWCQRQNGPLFCGPIFPTPGACLGAESLSCCPAPAQCSALSLPPPLTLTPYQLMGVGRGLRQGLWCSSQVMKLQVGNSTLCPPPICPHLSVDRIPQACSQSHSGQLRGTGGGRLRCHYPGSKQQTKASAIPELPASSLRELEELAKPTETRFPHLESSFYFIF